MPNSKITMGAASISAAQKLKALREDLGVSVQAMAIKSGLDPKHLKRVEQCESDCSILIMKKLLRAFKLDWTDFFDEEYIEVYIDCLEEENKVYED